MDYKFHGFESVSAMIRAASFALYVKGRGKKAVVIANNNFLGN